MIISYKWLCNYIPDAPTPERLSKILTSIGLEVEGVSSYSSLKGGLAGLITGEVLSCVKHAEADKLQVTMVNIGEDAPLQIVCGANNVAQGLKVIVAPPNTMLHPTTGEPFLIKKAKIRGVESNGMICAEDEIGVGTNHDGIIILPQETEIGKPAASLYDLYEDVIFEIGLTPNRMDAMSHMGVAKDVLAYINHHEKKSLQLRMPPVDQTKTVNSKSEIEVIIQNEKDCKRYSSVLLTGVKVGESPNWLKDVLRAIGVNPINNIVDITNYILHDMGQPLHAFDADLISNKKIIVKNAADQMPFTTLDGKVRQLLATDLVICDGQERPLCLAGVYGGKDSGVSTSTNSIFLESAWFSPGTVRRTSLKHGLRTDAATRFEKGVDISNTLEVLKRAAFLIKEIAGGTLASGFNDVYHLPEAQTTVGLKYHYLKKLSGKNYHGEAVKNILNGLGFTIVKDAIDELTVQVPFSKPDITLAADLVEEIMRIDGLDNIDIPQAITISPMASNQNSNNDAAEKMANYLTGLGFHEIFTNSITNSKYYSDAEKLGAVKMINNLSEDLDVMRPQMLQTGLEVVAHNLNRKNSNLRFFEIGKVYHVDGIGKYREAKRVSLFATGNVQQAGWNSKAQKADLFYMKGVCENIFKTLGIQKLMFENAEDTHLKYATNIFYKNVLIGQLGEVASNTLKMFDIKEAIFFADIAWDDMMALNNNKGIVYREIPKYPSVQRDLALVVDKAVAYAAIQKTIHKTAIKALQSVKLFDVFESEKLGEGKKSMAINFSFLDEAKTFTDSEIEGFMNKLITTLETDLKAEVRRT